MRHESNPEEGARCKCGVSKAKIAFFALRSPRLLRLYSVTYHGVENVLAAYTGPDVVNRQAFRCIAGTGARPLFPGNISGVPV